MGIPCILDVKLSLLMALSLPVKTLTQVLIIKSQEITATPVSQVVHLHHSELLHYWRTSSAKKEEKEKNIWLQVFYSDDLVFRFSLFYIIVRLLLLLLFIFTFGFGALMKNNHHFALLAFYIIIFQRSPFPISHFTVSNYNNLIVTCPHNVNKTEKGWEPNEREVTANWSVHQKWYNITKFYSSFIKSFGLKRKSFFHCI